jgi:hypothetical protein
MEVSRRNRMGSGEKMRGELGRRPIVSIAFLQARL